MKLPDLGELKKGIASTVSVWLSGIERAMNVVATLLAEVIFPSTTAYVQITELVIKSAEEVLTPWLGERLLRPDESIRERAMEAAQHLSAASSIVDALQVELQTRSSHLDKLIDEAAKYQEEAQHWAQLAHTNEELAGALVNEIERRVRGQLRAELDRRKRRQRLFALIGTIITLIVGAILGAAVQQYWTSGTFLPQP